MLEANYPGRAGKPRSNQELTPGSFDPKNAKHQGIQPPRDLAGDAAELDLELERLALVPRRLGIDGAGPLFDGRFVAPEEQVVDLGALRQPRRAERHGGDDFADEHRLVRPVNERADVVDRTEVVDVDERAAALT